MSYEVAVVNALSTTATNIHVYINVPKTTSSTNFKFDLTGPVTTDYSGNYTILYSTKAFSTSATAEPTSSNYVTADQVTDWSAIKSIEIQVDEIAGNSSAGYFYLNGTDATLASDVNKSASLAFLVTATGYDKPQIVAAGSSGSPSITISGTSTIKTVLEYVDANGVSQTVNLDYSKTYTDGTSVVRKTDFPWSTNYASWFDAHDVAIINNLLNQGYAIDSDNFPANTLENGSVTWQDGESNQTATFNVKAAYYFDDDKVVYKLRQVTANVSSVPTAGVTQLTDLQTGQTTTYPANTPVNSPVNDANSYTNHATATRTVQYVFEGNATNKPSVADVVQTINYESYNTYTVNLVTGAVLSTTTSDWTPVSGTTSATNTTIDENGQLTQTGAGDITDSTSIVPAVSGTFAGWYLDSSSNAGSTSLSVNQNTTGQLVYKHYQGATINYLDADNNDAILTTISVSGKQGDTIDFDYSQNLQNLLDQGYVLASSDYQTGATFDSDDNSDQTFTVKLVHGTTDSTETKTITRTIKVTNPDGSVTITTQPVTLSRTVTTDQVTGNKTYSDWTSGEWEDYTTPNIAGYTPTISSVAEMTVTSDLSDQTVQITYTPNQQQAQVNLIDQTTGAVLSQDALIGKSDQAIDFSTPNSQLAYYLAHGYQLASNNSNVTGDTITPTDYDRDDDETQVINVYLVHATVETTESKTVTRTINVHNPDGTITTTNQPVTLTRSVTTDQVTDKATYGEWSTGNWEQYDVPSQAGYTPSRTVVETSAVDGQTYDQSYDVYYTPNTQTAVVNVIDETTGQTIKTISLTGRTAENIDFSIANSDLNDYLANGYELSTSQASDVTEGEITPAVYDNNDQANQVYNVYLIHRIDGSTESKIVTRTINLTNPDGTITTTKQMATITRPVETDAVTKTITNGNWSSATWPTYSTPNQDGYTPTLKTIDERAVDGSTTDETVNISYVANQQIASVRIIDDTTNSTLNYDNLTGDSASSIDFEQTNQQIQNYLDQGYELASTNPDLTDSVMTPTDFDDDDDQNQDFTVHLIHGTSQSTDAKTVTRTIKIANPDGTVTTEEQPVTITRSVTTDLVTGEKTYGDWTSAEWPVFVTPTIAGYTPSTVVVMNSKVDGTTNDQTVNIGYRADQQLAAAIIIDDTTGQRLNNFGIFGPSDSQIDFSEANAQLAYYLAHGYVLSTQKTSDITEGVFSPSQFDHDDQQLQTFTVYLCHGTSESTEMRTVTRIINVTNPDGSQTTTSQPVELTRTVTTDLVTNQQTIGDWTSGQWSAYLTPTIKGYTPSQSEVDSSTVDGTTQDQIVNISYTADPQTAIVKIFDETTGVELGQRELNGTTGAKIDFTSSNNQLAYYLAHGYQLANDNSVITDNAITPANYNNDPDDVQTFTINLVHASQISQESKIITRTITIIKPDGTSDTLEQPITLTRQVETDQVTGDQTYGDWSTDEWPAFVVPVVDGYTPSQASVARENVDGDTNNQTVTITYQPNTQVATVELIDQTSGKTLQSLNLTGNSDSAIDFADANTLLTEYLKQGYQLANQNPQLTNGLLTPTNYDHDDTVDQDFKVYLVHQTSQSEESKTITRTIRIHKPDQTTEVIEQPVTLKRTITTDQVTGDQSFSAWSTADWEQYQLPTVNGYRPSQVMIDSAVVTGASSDQTIDVTYQANQQVATIKFIDDTTGETLSSQTITGPSNSAMDLKQTQDLLDSYWKQGYMLSTNNPDVNNGRLITRNFDADDQVDQELVIHLVHSTTTTDDPRTITRTINITQPDGQTSTEVQSVTINRTIITDNVTKVASIGDWTTGEWSQYSVPSISGYTPSQGQVDATTVDCETNDQVVNINYLPNAQLVQVNFIDQTTGQTIRTFDINGLSDASINFSAANQQLANYLEQGYALADDNHDLTTDLLNPANYDHDDQVNQTFNVYLVHQTEVTTETKTVTRTINLMLPDGTTKVIEQPVTLSRTVTTDQVTGDQEFGAWSTGDWEAYQVSAMSGYHPSQFTINSATVNGDSSDQTITVTYQADPQIAQVTFIDQTTGQELQTINLTGVSDAAIDFSAANDQLNDYLNHGYVLTADNHDLTDGELAPTDYDHDDQVNQGFNVYLKHATLTTTENKTLTRTINVQLPDGTTTVIKQPTTLSRSVTTDQVTGDQAYGEWSTGEWDAYQVPDITGYTPSQMTIDQVPVNGDASDQTINVSYQADPRTATIEFVDKSNGTVLATLTTNGGVNEAIDFTQANQTLASLLQDGYMLSSDNQSITNQQLSPATYNLAGDQFFTVNLVHQPKSVITTQESRKITRTILLWLPKGEVESVVQTAVISRMVMTDEETGEQTYGDWSNADWPAYTVPEVDGYTPTQTNVSESDVNGNTSDQTITISYQSDPQVATVTFVDQTNGKVLQTTNLTGESNDKIDFSTVNDQLATYLEQGYELGSQNPDVRANQLIPADFDQDPQVNQNFTVYLTHQTDSSTEKQTITRTIKVHLPNGTVTTVVQPATLTRTVTTDQVSGQQTTSDWSTGEWEAYQVPTIAGYTASQLTVDQTSVNADTTNQVIDVSYQADSQVAQVIFVDQTSGQSIQTVTLTGRSDEVIDFTSINEMIRAYLAAGYDLALVNPDLTNDQVTSTKYDHNDSTNQAFQIFLVHQFSEGQESKTVARTITLHLPDGTNQVIKQPVTLTRSVTTDLVTGQSSYGEWSTSSWPVYAVNTIDGYTASLAQVESEIVNSTTADEAIDIYYLADSPAEQATSNTITTSQTSTNANLSNDKLVKLSPTKANSQQTTSNRRMKLPQTGNNYDAALLGLGLASTAALISMLGFSKKKDEHS